MHCYFDPIQEAIKRAYMPISEQDIKSVDIGQDTSPLAADEGLTGAGDPAEMAQDTGMVQDTGDGLPAEVPPPANVPPPADTDFKDEILPKVKFGPSMKDVRGKIHDVSLCVAKIIGKLEGRKIMAPEDVFELKQALEMANEKLTWVMDSTDDLRVK